MVLAILKENPKQSALKLDLSRHCYLKLNDHSKHTSLLVKNLQKTKENVIEWQSPDLNPNENVLGDLNNNVKEELARIPQKKCQRLIENYND